MDQKRRRRIAVLVVALLTVPVIGFVAAAPARAEPADGAKPRIVGGQPATPGTFPWMAWLAGPVGRCGGTVIAPRLILTAAHCVNGTGPDTGMTATLGRTDITAPGGEVITSDYVLRSPRYPQTSTYDWALVELAHPTASQPLPIAYPGDTSMDNGSYYVMGWGTTREGGPLSSVLRYAVVPSVDDATCSAAYPTEFRQYAEMCAGPPGGGVDSCQGDSGGPLVKYVDGRPVEAGIVSYGRGCGRPGYPGVYARVEALSAEIDSHITPQGGLRREPSARPAR